MKFYESEYEEVLIALLTDGTAWQHTHGSARETFDWGEPCRVRIPLPPVEVQQPIASLYRCMEESRRIAEEARELLRTFGPALIQKAVNR